MGTLDSDEDGYLFSPAAANETESHLKQSHSTARSESGDNTRCQRMQPYRESSHHSRDRPVDLLHADELELFHDVRNACASGEINSWVIKQVGETHFIPGA